MFHFGNDHCDDGRQNNSENGTRRSAGEIPDDLPLSRIDAAYLDSLRTDAAVVEGRQIEYKEQLPTANDDEAKREFLRDVTSFGNIVGGDS